MQNPWIRRLLPLLVIAVAVAIAVVMIRGRADLPRRERVIPVPVVEVMIAQPGPVQVSVHSRGTVTPKREIELVSEVSGRVIWVAPEFVAGGQVKQGATLLRIDPIDYEVALSEARAAVASAKFSLAEVQVVVMRAAIEEAEARVLAAKDRLRQAEIDLANTAIAAPFDAIIDVQRVDLGQYVSAGTAVMELLSTSTAEVRLPLLASDVPFVRHGQFPDGSWSQAALTARFGNVEYSWQARLVRLEQRVDAQTRVFYLVAEIEAPYDSAVHGQPLSVGQFVEADVGGTEIAQATRIPRSALHDGEFVFVVRQGSLQRRPVSLLRSERDSVIIGAGLASGDQVVLSRLDLMVEGMSVSVAQ
ncbi:MAG: efflux RND transporter periplasmic adaptor subunit [Halioglobus sp.]